MPELFSLTPAEQDVITERRAHVTREGWTPEHDDQHVDGSLAFAAACYAGHAGAESAINAGPTHTAEFNFIHRVQEWVGHGWPWPRRWWKPSTPRRCLVKAAALILAEIERLDRAASR